MGAYLTLTHPTWNHCISIQLGCLYSLYIWTVLDIRTAWMFVQYWINVQCQMKSLRVMEN